MKEKISENKKTRGICYVHTKLVEFSCDVEIEVANVVKTSFLGTIIFEEKHHIIVIVKRGVFVRLEKLQEDGARFEVLCNVHHAHVLILHLHQGRPQRPIGLARESPGSEPLNWQPHFLCYGVQELLHGRGLLDSEFGGWSLFWIKEVIALVTKEGFL